MYWEILPRNFLVTYLFQEYNTNKQNFLNPVAATGNFELPRAYMSSESKKFLEPHL